MSLSGEYLGMPVLIDDLDKDNQTFYRYCGQNELRAQECLDCRLKRLPPTSACPFCASERMEWRPVEGRGTVYSYGEVHHAIQGAFRSHLPYHLLLVELDEQKDIPNPYDGLRLQGNLAEIDGSLATKETVNKLGKPAICSPRYASGPNCHFSLRVLPCLPMIFDLSKAPVIASNPVA